MKEKQKIFDRINRLEDDILFTNTEEFHNFFNGSDLKGSGEMRGAYLALKWIVEEDEDKNT